MRYGSLQEARDNVVAAWNRVVLLRKELAEAELEYLAAKKRSDEWPGGLPPRLVELALDAVCECLPLATRGQPGDLEVYCPKCGKVFRASDAEVER
jgi:hypothetical protein